MSHYNDKQVLEPPKQLHSTSYGSTYVQNDVTEMPVLAHLVEWLQCVCVVFIILKHQATDACRLGLVILVQLFHHRHLVNLKLCNKKTLRLGHAVRLEHLTSYSVRLLATTNPWVLLNTSEYSNTLTYFVTTQSKTRKNCEYNKLNTHNKIYSFTRVGTLILATIYLQLIQNRYVLKFYCPSM